MVPGAEPGILKEVGPAEFSSKGHGGGDGGGGGIQPLGAICIENHF